MKKHLSLILVLLPVLFLALPLWHKNVKKSEWYSVEEVQKG